MLGGSPGFWLTREAQYRAQRARLDAVSHFADWTDWLEKLPVKELMHAGAISKHRMDAKGQPVIVEEMLRFFGVASPEEWSRHYADMEVSFRRTREEQSDVGAISAWLRMGEIQAEQLDGPKYGRARLEEALKEIRTLTVRPPEEFEPKAQAVKK